MWVALTGLLIGVLANVARNQALRGNKAFYYAGGVVAEKSVVNDGIRFGTELVSVSNASNDAPTFIGKLDRVPKVESLIGKVKLGWFIGKDSLPHWWNYDIFHFVANESLTNLLRYAHARHDASCPLRSPVFIQRAFDIRGSRNKRTWIDVHIQSWRRAIVFDHHCHASDQHILRLNGGTQIQNNWDASYASPRSVASN